MKRVLSWILMLALIVSYIPVAAVPVYAQQTPGYTVETLTLTDTEPADNQQMLEGYAYQLFYGETATYGRKAGDRLTGDEKLIYDALVPIVGQIAAGERSSAVIGLGQEREYNGTLYTVDAPLSFTISDLTQEGLSRIMSALLVDMPYEMYWYDKVTGVKTWALKGSVIENLQFYFSVADNYQGDGEYIVDCTEARAAATAAKNSAAIVAKYAGKSDYDKLVGYKTEICQLVEYDTHAAITGGFSLDDDPWQLIHVFDGDTTTNVVCEGYSKAFMYLCQQTDFSSDISCVTVTGEMGGPHMWNIVTIGESNYLVDVTNSESNTVGYDGSLFLAGGSGTIYWGYTVGTQYYQYSDSDIACWGADEDSVLYLASRNYTPPQTTFSGTCGDAITWFLGEDGVLTLSGEGDIPDYTSNSSAPYYKYRSRITKIVINSGISGIGAYAFYDLYTATEVQIPESVTEIGDHAFGSCDVLTELTIPENVTEIGDYAFAYCNGLTELIIPDSVESIGASAFEQCKSLVRVDMGTGVLEIGESAFYGCFGLQDLYIHDVNSWCRIIFGRYSSSPGANAENVHFLNADGSEITQLVLDSSVTFISYTAFRNAKNLVTVYIPGSVSTIDERAFYNCTGLTKVIMAEGVTTVGNQAFANCASLTQVDMPSSVTTIGDEAFNGCNLQRLNYNGTAEQWRAIEMGAYNNTLADTLYIGGNSAGIFGTDTYWTFDGEGTLAIYGTGEMPGFSHDGTTASVPWKKYAGQITHAVIGEGLTTIGFAAFFNNTSLTAVTIPASVTEIRSYVFEGCKNLTDIYYGGTMEQWQAIEVAERNYYLNRAMLHIDGKPTGSCGANTVWVLENDGTLVISGTGMISSEKNLTWGNYVDSIKKVVISEGITNVGGGAFESCTQLQEVVLPSTITTIDYEAFSGCSKLTKITLPVGITTIEYKAFYNCSSLTELQIPSTVTTIGYSAFSGCSSLTAINIPNTITQIEAAAFAGCESLREITIPAEITFIAANAFSNCTRLERIYYHPIQARVDGSFNNVGIHGDGVTLIVGAEVLQLPDYFFNNSQALVNVIFEEGSACRDIGVMAFYNCTALKSVELPENLLTIGEKAFAECGALEEIYLNAIDMVELSERDYVFANSGFDGSGITLFVGQTVESIPDNMFLGDPRHVPAKTYVNLVKISFAPNSVCRHIGSKAFYNCEELLAVDIPGSMETIGASAFYRCYNIKQLNVQSVLDWVEIDFADEEASPMKRYADFCVDGVPQAEILVPEGVTVIRPYTFANSEKIISIILPEGVTEIGDYAFYACLALETINIPSTVTYIGQWALHGTKITSVQIPEHVTVISEGAFAYCESLVTVGVHTGLVSIEKMAFESCHALANITIPETVTSIGVAAFYDCSSLKTIRLPEGLTYLGESAFTGCSSLTAISIPDSITAIPSNLLYNCKNLTDLTIGDYVTSIESSAFSCCEKLKDINIPASVTLISFGAFYGCKKLTDVYYGGTKAQWSAVKIGDDNALLTQAKIHYNSGVAPLSAPEVALDRDPDTNAITLTWDLVDNADYYTVYRATSKTGTYSVVGAQVTDTFWVDTKATVNKTYYYKVKAIFAAESSLSSGYSNIAYIVMNIDEPELMLQMDSAGKPVLSWSSIAGAKKYEIYRATSENGTYTKLTTVTKITYTDAKVSTGYQYFYKVRAVSSSSTYNSGYSNIESCLIVCAVPAVKTGVDEITGKPSFTWKSVSGAVGYRVFRRGGGDTSFMLIAEPTDAFFEDATAAVDTQYEYQFQTVGQQEELDSAKTYSMFVTCGIARPKLTTGTNEQGKPVIFWEAVEGAVRYAIYRSTSASKSYSKLVTVSDLSYTDDTVAAGKTYYYKVVAEGVNSVSANSAYISATGKCGIPELTVQPGSTGKPVLTWNKIAGAKKYEIWRSVDGGDFKKLTTVKKLTYTDTKATEGAECTYKVKALGSKSAFNGNFSETVGCYVTCAAPSLTAKIDTVSGKPSLSWKKITGAAGYAIYRSVDGGEYVLLAETNATSYTDQAAKADQKCGYYVVTLGKADVFNSVESAVKTVTATCAQPTITGTSNAEGKPVITWEAVEDAVAYKIYRATSTSASKFKTPIATVTDLSYVDPVAAGKTYYYKVVAVSENGTSAKSDYVKLDSKCAQPVATVGYNQDSGKPTLTWEKVTGAKKYEIWRSTSRDSGFKKISTVTKTTYSDTTAVAGTRYFYQVRAVGSKSSYNSLFSDATGCLTICAKPVVTVKLDTKAYKPSLTWKAVSGAERYEIYRATRGGAFQLIGTVNKPGYVDQSAQIGDLYRYQVKAVGNPEFCSNTSKEAVISIPCKKTTVKAVTDETGKPAISWTPVEGATIYAVYRSTKKTSGFKQCMQTTDTTYVDKNANKGTTYYYYVTAMAQDTESDKSNVVKIKCAK